MVDILDTRTHHTLHYSYPDKESLKLHFKKLHRKLKAEEILKDLILTSLEDLGAATCKLVNFVDHKVQTPSKVLRKSF